MWLLARLNNDCIEHCWGPMQEFVLTTTAHFQMDAVMIHYPHHNKNCYTENMGKVRKLASLLKWIEQGFWNCKTFFIIRLQNEFQASDYSDKIS